LFRSFLPSSHPDYHPDSQPLNSTQLDSDEAASRYFLPDEGSSEARYRLLGRHALLIREKSALALPHRVEQTRLDQRQLLRMQTELSAHFDEVNQAVTLAVKLR